MVRCADNMERCFSIVVPRVYEAENSQIGMKFVDSSDNSQRNLPVWCVYLCQILDY